jgi:hypothetical protein
VRDLLVTPPIDHIGPAAQDQMQMITQDRVGQAVDGEDRCQELAALSNPPPAMFEALSSDRIISTESCATYTTMKAVKDLDLPRIHVFTASFPSHELPPSQGMSFSVMS